MPEAAVEVLLLMGARYVVRLVVDGVERSCHDYEAPAGLTADGAAVQYLRQEGALRRAPDERHPAAYRVEMRDPRDARVVMASVAGFGPPVAPTHESGGRDA